MYVFVKQPRDVLDYDILLSRWIEQGDSLIEAPVEYSDGIELESVEVLDAAVKLWIGGGEHGKRYKFSVLLTMASGRLKEVDFYIAVRDK